MMVVSKYQYLRFPLTNNKFRGFIQPNEMINQRKVIFIKFFKTITDFQSKSNEIVKMYIMICFDMGPKTLVLPQLNEFCLKSNTQECI